jgi:hypothetical protein
MDARRVRRLGPSPVSAICGISFGGTKLPTSISATPAAAMAAIQRCFTGVGMIDAAICSPSRGPTSQTMTCSRMDVPFRQNGPKGGSGPRRTQGPPAAGC